MLLRYILINKFHHLFTLENTLMHSQGYLFPNNLIHQKHSQLHYNLLHICGYLSYYWCIQDYIVCRFNNQFRHVDILLHYILLSIGRHLSCLRYIQMNILQVFPFHNLYYHNHKLSHYKLIDKFHPQDNSSNTLAHILI